MHIKIRKILIFSKTEETDKCRWCCLLDRLIPRSDPYQAWIGLTSLTCSLTSRAVFLGHTLPKLKWYQGLPQIKPEFW